MDVVEKAVFMHFNSIHLHSSGGTGENKVHSLSEQPLSKRSYEIDIYWIYQRLEHGAGALDVRLSA